MKILLDSSYLLREFIAHTFHFYDNKMVKLM